MLENRYSVSSGFIRYLEIDRVTVIFQGSIDAALKLPIIHTTVRQLPLATANCKNKDGGPNSADGRVLYVNVHFSAFSRLDFSKVIEK